MLKLLCVTDLLSESSPELVRARLLADTLSADLLVLRVVAPGESSEVLEQSLRSDTDLLVIGTHARRGIRDAMGSLIAGTVLAERACPVLIVGGPPQTAYRKVLLALDESAASIAAVRAAEKLVISEAVDASVVHAFDTPYREVLQSSGTSATSIERYTSGWLNDAANRIRDLLKHHSVAFNRYDVQIEEGRPAAGILRAAETQRPDLLVLGTGSHGFLHRAFLGSVANEVMFKAGCDVLVVPEEHPTAATLSTVLPEARGQLQ
jgi:nucleotide-binding universal stress UspA family protein